MNLSMKHKQKKKKKHKQTHRHREQTGGCQVCVGGDGAGIWD